MIKIIIAMIAGAAILFFVFATIGAYRAVSKAEEKYEELEKIVKYEYEKGYGDGFRAGVKDTEKLQRKGETDE